MSDDFKALIAKVATGATLTREEAAHAFDRMMSGEATPSQMGGFLMALRVRGETVDEITGAVADHARQDAAGRRRRRTRSTSSAPAATPRGSYNISTCAAFIVAGAGVPVAKHGNRALSSHSGAADVLGALGVKIDLPPGRDRALHPRGRHRLHVRAGASSGDEACRPDARRARHPHDLQPARPALQSGRREAADGRRVLAAMGRAAGAGARRISAPSAPGWCTAPTGSTRSPPPAPTSVAALENGTVRDLRDHAGGCRPARAPSRRRCAAATPSTTPRRCATCSRASKAPFRDVALLNAGGRAGGRRQGQGPEGRRCAGRASRSTPARPKAGSTG